LIPFGSSNDLGDIAIERISLEGFSSVGDRFRRDTVLERLARLSKWRDGSTGRTQKGNCDEGGLHFEANQGCSVK
jgi:hypothetical protein